MYDPKSASWIYDRSLNIFYNWGIAGKAIAEACKPFISNELYQRAISDPNIPSASECNNISNQVERNRCKAGVPFKN